MLHTRSISTRLNKFVFENNFPRDMVKELEYRMQYENNRIHSITHLLVSRITHIKQLASDRPGKWSQQRFRRFVLAPGAGKILKFLTGTADADDLSTLNEKIDSLNDNQKNTAHQVQLQASILDTLHSEQRIANSLLLNVSHYTYEVGIALKNVQEVVNNQSASRDNVISAMNQFTRIAEQITDLTLDCRNMLNTLTHEINSLLKGRLPWSLVSPDRFISFLKEIGTHIPSDWNAVTPSSTGSLWTYYSKAKIVVLPVLEGLRIFVSVPLLSPRSNFDIFHILPFPTPAPNTSHHIVALFQHPFIAISKDREYYVLHHTIDFNNCLELPIPVCNRRKPLMSITTSPSCESALWMRDAVMIDKLCSFGVSLEYLPLLIEIKPHTWLYHLPHKIDITLHCQQLNQTTTIQPLSLSTTGILYVPPQCSVSCPYFVIPRIFFGQTRLSSSNPTYSPINVSEFQPIPNQLPIKNLLTLPPISLNNTTLNGDKVMSIREIILKDNPVHPHNHAQIYFFSSACFYLSFLSSKLKCYILHMLRLKYLRQMSQI